MDQVLENFKYSFYLDGIILQVVCAIEYFSNVSAMIGRAKTFSDARNTRNDAKKQDMMRRTKIE